MKSFSPPFKAGVQRALMALTLTTACATTWAQQLPEFTLNPAGVGLAGDTVISDNIIISDYSTIRLDSDTGSFTDRGFLAVSNFQRDNTNVMAGGLNSTYGLFIEFTATGSQNPGDPTTSPTFGTFETLEYTLFGYNGPAATFGFNGSNDPTVSVGEGDRVTLATGSLIEGAVSSVPLGNPFTPSAAANLTFEVAQGAEGFFVDPNPFYPIAFSVFTNTASQVTLFDGGFRIQQGGGAINFAIPEPSTYALMLAGLAAVGTVVRRRRKL